MTNIPASSSTPNLMQQPDQVRRSEKQSRKIRDLLAKRAAFYAKADHTVDTGKLTAKQAVEKIVGIADEAKNMKEGRDEPKS